MKQQFLETARHYAELGELGPLTGLQESAQALVQALEGAAGRREEYWKNRIKPFWKSVWPKSLELVTEEISESLAELCIAAGSNFPSAFDMLRNLGYVVNFQPLPCGCWRRSSEINVSARRN